MRAILIRHDNSPKGYSEIKRDEYPNIDPNAAITFTPDLTGYEWLHFFTENSVPNDYDPRIWEQNEVVVGPTTIKHPVYTNINQFRTEITLVKRAKEDIINSIREKEAWANSTLIQESEKDKMYTLTNLAQQRQFEGITLTEQELAVINRMKEVGVKVWQNAQRAEALIAIVDANNEPDIDTGWQLDDLTDNGFPFGE
ncbi:MAG: hypothetical protein HC896_11660 [Bacteroidales bacterium]|nr:hypothetical protein [Bacteroidales bacterium]